MAREGALMGKLNLKKRLKKKWRNRYLVEEQEGTASAKALRQMFAWWI